MNAKQASYLRTRLDELRRIHTERIRVEETAAGAKFAAAEEKRSQELRRKLIREFAADLRHAWYSYQCLAARFASKGFRVDTYKGKLTVSNERYATNGRSVQRASKTPERRDALFAAIKKHRDFLTLGGIQDVDALAYQKQMEKELEKF
jgi:hypothetical protein